jgi:hypothetical protein
MESQMSSLITTAAPRATVSREACIEQDFHAQRGTGTPPQAYSVVEFWREAGPSLWFAKDKAFDRRFRERLQSTHEAAARGELDGWLATPYGALALIILLDQFPRNAFRGSSCISPSGIPRNWPTRSARSLSQRALASPIFRTRNGIATSCSASADFLTAIRSSDAPCARKSRAISTRAATRASQ